LKVPLLIGCCACWVELLPLPMVLELPEPLPMVELPVLGLVVVFGGIVLLPVPLLVPPVWACAVEKASAVPAVRRATVRRRENIGSPPGCASPYRQEDLGRQFGDTVHAVCPKSHE
jgi:hypothetical protein